MMEINSSNTLEQFTTQFAELIQDLILLRPRLILPEQMSSFREQLERLKCSNISSKDDFQAVLRVFIVMAHQAVPPTMGELSSALSVPFSTATRLVDGLVQCGFVERAFDPDDRRIVRVLMTNAGEQYYRISLEHLQERIRFLIEYFTPEEQADLYRLLSKLISALNQSNP